MIQVQVRRPVAGCNACSLGRPRRRLGEASEGGFNVVGFALGMFGLGVLGIVALEWSQGWRPGRRRGRV